MNEVAEYIISTDSCGNELNGSNRYKLQLPAGMPASEFWSLIVYDSKTSLIIKTDQPWPSVHSNCKHLVVNGDGTVDILFGPDPSAGVETNWIKTVPRKGWHAVIRIYNLKESDSSGWKPGEIVVIQ